MGTSQKLLTLPVRRGREWGGMMFKDVSNTIQNFIFLAVTVSEIGGGRLTLPPWYQVWVPKGLVQEGSYIFTYDNCYKIL